MKLNDPVSDLTCSDVLMLAWKGSFGNRSPIPKSTAKRKWHSSGGSLT